MIHAVLSPEKWEEAIEILARISEETRREADALRTALEKKQMNLAEVITRDVVNYLRKESSNLQMVLEGFSVDRGELKSIAPKDWGQIVGLLEAISQKTERGAEYIKELINESKTEIVEDILELTLEGLNWDLWELEDLLADRDPTREE